MLVPTLFFLLQKYYYGIVSLTESVAGRAPASNALSAGSEDRIVAGCALFKDISDFNDSIKQWELTADVICKATSALGNSRCQASQSTGGNLANEVVDCLRGGLRDKSGQDGEEGSLGELHLDWLRSIRYNECK